MNFPRLSPRARRRIDRIRYSAFGWLLYPFYLTANLFRWAFGLVGAWWARRDLRFLFQGLPALAVFTGLVVLGSFALFKERTAVASEYKVKAEELLYVEAARAKR